MYSSYKRHLPRSYVMGTLIRRREDPEFVTEMCDDVGTTAEVIGDVTMEVMITTPGEIPNEMYDLSTTHEDLRMNEHHEGVPESHKKGMDGVTGFAAHSTLFTVLLVALLLLVLVCCISACIIARARRKYSMTSDMECDAECRGGAKQPLIGSDKMSETTSRASANSTRR